MKNINNKLINIYYFVGALLLFNISKLSNDPMIGKYFFNYWLLSTVPLAVFLLIKKKFILKGKLDYILIYFYSLISIPLNIISNNYSIIPFNIITNLIYSKDFSDNNNKIYKITRLISYLGIIFYFLKAISIGRYFSISPFLFSENMVILPFLPFMILYHFYKRRYWDTLLYYLIIIIFFLSFSISNLVLASFLFVSLFLPNDSFENFYRFQFKKFFKSKILVSDLKKLLLLIMILIPAIYLFKNIFNNLNSDDIKRVLYIFELLNEIGMSIFSEIYMFIPRLSFINDYLDSLSFIQYFIGNPKIVFYSFFSEESITNPHNSIILAHMNMGIFGILIYFQIIFRILNIFINKTIKFSILALSLLIRSLTDSILVLSGFSSFLIFWILFGKLNQVNKISNKKKDYILN